MLSEESGMPSNKPKVGVVLPTPEGFGIAAITLPLYHHHAQTRGPSACPLHKLQAPGTVVPERRALAHSSVPWQGDRYRTSAQAVRD